MRTKLETALAALVFILPSTTAYAATPQEMVGIVRSKAEAAVEERLRDPQSVNFYNVTAYRMRAGSNVPTAVCGEFNAKNGFGGYHGREPFVWIAFDETLHVDFDHGTAFLGSEVYTRKMLVLCKFPISE